MQTQRGSFITFEGLDGCGKSTQMQRLVARLQRLFPNDPQRILTLREPGSTAIGEDLRSLIKCEKRGASMFAETEFLLFSASRTQLVREVIAPALAEGKIVLCDRFVDSTIVYQGAARKLDSHVIEMINQFAIGNCLPDVTILLDLPIEALRHRIGGRIGITEDRIEKESNLFFENVRRGYQQLAASQAQRFILMDAMLPPDQIEQMIWTQLEKRFSWHFPKT